MNIILWIMMLLLGCSVGFQIRDIVYMSIYERPNSEAIECHYRYKFKKQNGHTSVECRNKFYCKKFERNGRICSENCKGKRYPNIDENFERMSSTDNFYIVKKAMYLVSSILSVLLTILNILDKM